MKAALAIAMLAACSPTTGTLQLELVTAPGSNLLGSIQRIELALTNPRATFEAERTADGIDLAFEIDAVTSEGALLIQAFDASDTLIANGQSPPFPLAGTDATVAIYLAPPYSILPGPVGPLEPARSLVGGTTLRYGAVFAGGLDATGIPSASMAIYNIYDHSLGYGEDMPVRRAAPTLAANDTAGVYVLGGTDEATVATSTLHRFQTNVAPRGVYSDLGVHPGLESAGQRALEIGFDTFFVTGLQPALITASEITPITSLAGVPPTATAATTVDGEPIAAFVREGIVGFYEADGTVGEVALPSIDTERAIAARPEAGTVVVVGGATRDVFVVAFASQSVIPHANVLSVVRRRPTVAATSRHVLVANGFDETGTLHATADILDATTLELVATIPLAPRASAVALPMPNDQILIAGGDYQGNTPDGQIELFTPPVPTDPAPRSR